MIKDRLLADMQQALRNHAAARLSTIRLILAALQKQEIALGRVLTEEEIISLLGTMAKQTKEAIAQYQAGQRTELAEREANDLAVIQEYLPAPLSAEEISKLIVATAAQVEAMTVADMSKVMRALKAQVHGRVDMAQLSQQVLQYLGTLK